MTQAQPCPQPTTQAQTRIAALEAEVRSLRRQLHDILQELAQAQLSRPPKPQS